MGVMAQEPHASILVVDDDSVIRELLSHWLSDDGIHVETADTAAEALALTLHRPFDLVVSDVNMPRDSGLDLVSYLRKYRPALPVILMSGYKQVEVGLTKPFTRDELRHAIHQALSEGAPARG
jgi:CheY-like chemotaxis protein